MKHRKLKLLASFAFFIVNSIPAFSQPTPDIFAPRFSHLSGRYTTDIQVQLTTVTPNAVIYYTLDSTEPDSTSQLYTGSISIAGNGNYKILKAITVIPDSAQSKISSANYIIDYNFDPNAAYRTDLTWTQYNALINGNWFGHASTPWTCDYNVTLSILPNDNYIDTTTSTGCQYPFSDDFPSVFYYGAYYNDPLKKITIYNILASGYANGYVTIVFNSGGTNQDELRYIKFIDDNNLYLEMWHASQYGPLKYYLTNQNSGAPVGYKEYQQEKTLIYPNPTSDQLYIKDLNSNVQFTNQLGQSFVIEKSKKLNVSQLPKGLYNISFQNSDGVQIRQKLILE